MKSENNKELDPQFEPAVVEMIRLLKPTPARDQDDIERGRNRFLAELDEIYLPKEFSSISKIRSWVNLLQEKKEKIKMESYKQKFAVTAFIGVVILVLVFGGGTVTAFAAQSSIPGDTLYTVKTKIEETRVALAGNSYSKAELHLGFAEERIVEIARLIEEGRLDKVKNATTGFERDVDLALGALQDLSKEDPTRVADLAEQVSTTLARYADTLSMMVESVPESVKPDVQHAAMISMIEDGSPESGTKEIEFTGVLESISPDSWLVNGQVVKITAQTEIKDLVTASNLVKVHALVMDDGSLVAREVELVDGESGEVEVENHEDVEMRLEGFVDEMAPGVWVINGTEVLVTADTEIEDFIQGGDFVKVRFIETDTGSFLAIEIELDDDFLGENENEGNENEGNENENENENFNENENANEVNENQNENENENLNNNQNENQNENENDNDDDDNENDDDDDNENDDDDDDNENDDDDDDDNENDDD